MDAAVAAQDTIRNMPIKERVRLGVRITEEISRSVKEYAIDCSLEHGKPLRESLAEVEDAIPNILWQVEDLKRWDSPAQEGYSKDNVLYMCLHEPLGTVVTISPWNFPWVLPAEFVVQAMLAGDPHCELVRRHPARSRQRWRFRPERFRKGYCPSRIS